MAVILPDSLKQAVPLLRVLLEAGFEAVFVGGAVRDTLIGKPVKDVDIATSATPEKVMELFPKCIPTGLQHGTVTVMHDGVGYEVTTFRTESAYENYRRPEDVQFITDLMGDMQRRDFTINAMAFRADGELIDYFGGAADIRDGVLRCVGDADARFQEDALRMLRAIRFIAVYRYRPSYSTWRALIRHRMLLRFIAMERVQAELDKMMDAPNPATGLRWLFGSGLLRYTKEPLDPALIAAGQAEGAARSWRVNKARFAALCVLAEPDSRWAAACMEASLDVEAVNGLLGRLRFSNERKHHITSLLRIDASIRETADEQLREHSICLVLQYGKGRMTEWLRIADALSAARQLHSADRRAAVSAAVQAVHISSTKELNVNGRDLMKHLQRKAGPWMKVLLGRLLYSVASGELRNDRNELLEQASKWSEAEGDIN